MESFSIYSDVSPRYLLADRRFGRQGLVFGTVESVARQYGIKIVQKDDIIEFIAPKSRIQMIAEKLHFSGVSYWE